VEWSVTSVRRSGIQEDIMPKDYYKALGSSRTATADEIKKAYRKLARKHHPDLNPNNAEAKKLFQEINEANEVLSDPESRKRYDAYGDQWKHAEQFEQTKREQGSRQSTSGQGGAPFGGGGMDGEDLFSSMFGGGRGRQVKFRGQDYQTELRLDAEAAYTTHKQTLNVNSKQIRISVPAGVENEQSIRIPGQGGAGVNGGPNGDLYITFIVAQHPRFKRVGKDLFITQDLDLPSAMLGGEIMVETMDGKVKLKVAPETQNSTKVKLKGKGFPVYKQEGQFGDLYVTYNVKLPTGLSEREQELFRELAAIRNTAAA